MALVQIGLMRVSEGLVQGDPDCLYDLCPILTRWAMHIAIDTTIETKHSPVTTNNKPILESNAAWLFEKKLASQIV
ncbi:hypothetical protein GCM10007898_14490 [Dyella flagellata]|uniref:Uncharacterized protein n=1 Tax=Dyella flagellata TaxID=1867833 RepID=A0ABQ5X8B1_9GAMM|nr:hypothetical protein GCM10007898_14490 [Dyella flagellata]